MRSPRSSILFLAVLVVGVLLVRPPAAASQGVEQGTETLFDRLAKAGPGGPAPVRDLGGSWTGPTGAKMGEAPPMTALGQERFTRNIPDAFSARSNDPYRICDPLGFPRSAVNETRGLAFGQMPGRIIIMTQFQKIWRVVWMDGRALPRNAGIRGGPDARWYGYSVGRWDGDYTLIVETTGVDESTWIDRRGYPHSVEMRVEERYTRVNHNTLEVTITVYDPKIYTKPFVAGTNTFRWLPEQEDEEQLCVPSEALEYLRTIVGPADQDAATGKK